MKPVTAIVFKDVVIGLRNKESISAMLMFGVLVLVTSRYEKEFKELKVRLSRVIEQLGAR